MQRVAEPAYRLSGTRRVDRRSFLLETSSLLAAAAWSTRAFGAVKSNPKLSDYPFKLGVASGDPTAEGVVLWTRLAPDPLVGGGMPDEPVDVSWQVAHDEQMTKVVCEGTTTAVPDWAHSVHVEVNGLEPGRWYWYQFKCGSEVSPKARTRTMPAPQSTPERARFAVASCQNWEAGYYTAYEHMLREDVDLVLHLGDYIYEGTASRSAVRRHVGGHLDTLPDFRNRYAQYKSDPALQGMHAAAPFLVTWDDHEVQNNYASDAPLDRHADKKSFLDLRARGYKAFYEHMPLRQSSLPQGPEMTIYRRFNYGRLAELFVLDTRQYRSDQSCDEQMCRPCPDVYARGRTILGQQQRKWLFDGLSSTSETWKVLAQQVMMARVDLLGGPERLFHMDKWAGYEIDRRRLLQHIRDCAIMNAVVLSGDIHSHWANELMADFGDSTPKAVAAEFVGTAISSPSGLANDPRTGERLMADNPFVKFFNPLPGYLRCDVTPREWQTTFRTIDQVQRPGGTLQTPATFVLESDSSKLHAVSTAELS